MKEKIVQIRKKIKAESINNKEALEAFRIQYLGTKGVMKELFGDLKAVANEHKKEAGQLLNSLRMDLEEIYQKHKENLEDSKSNEERIDLTRPSENFNVGSRHPLSLVRSEII